MPKISAKERSSIESYLSEDLDTLYSILDHSSASRETAVYAPGGEKKRGEATFVAMFPRLRTYVCDEWEFCAKRNDPDLMDTVNLVAGIADGISSLVFGFPPTLIAVILVKKGLSRLCGCND